MRWLPTILTALLAAATAIVPDVQDVVKDNPVASAIMLSILALLGALAKSPLGQKK